MKAVLTRESHPARHRNAVIFCCDTKYLPYAALAIHTLLRVTPRRDFDICIVSEEWLSPPQSLTHADIRMCQIDIGSTFDGFPTSDRFSQAAYLRIILAEVFDGTYDRILYLDCDTMIVGEELNAIFSLELHGKPVGAASDSLKLKRPNKPTFDQAAIGMDGPYFNSGVLLIDTQAFLEQDIKGRCKEQLNRFDEDKLHFDQTILNLALQGNWTRLDLAWNWQWAIVRPMFEIFVNVQIVHFISAHKPWNDPAGQLPASYRRIAELFLKENYPDIAVKTGAYPRRLRVGQLFKGLFKHMFMASRFRKAYNENGGDIYRTSPPQ